MAHILIKLTSIYKRYIIERVNKSESGITEATTRPERIFPNKRTTTNITIRIHRIRLSAIVVVVFSINLLLSINGLMYTTDGKDDAISYTISGTFRITL